MKTLAEIYQKWAVSPDRYEDLGHGDKGTIHSYIPEYEELLSPYRNKCSFMEIGLAQGMSVGLWDDYFGEECSLHGADLSLHFDTSRFPRWKFFKVNAASDELKHAVSGIKFDVVIDDASHQTHEQTATRDILLHHMNPGGLYIIEDILDLEGTRHLFGGAEIRDLRGKKNRFDDVLVIYHT